MADPRGHGFNRGNGEWHRHAPAIRPGTPGAYGWKLSHWNEEYRLPVWSQGSTKLMKHHDGSGRWCTQEGDSTDALVWECDLETLTNIIINGGGIGCEIPFSGEPGEPLEPLTEADDYGLEPAF